MPLDNGVFLSSSSSDSEVVPESLRRGGGIAPRGMDRVGGGGKGTVFDEGVEVDLGLTDMGRAIALPLTDERREEVDAALLE
jgi:hypothetical protein